jgi:LacI family transcriptional regulator
MNPVILFLNDTGRDPTKRLKLAGVRRYAAATGWNVIPIPQEKSSSKSLAGLLERYRPVGCICDEDSTPTRATPRLFGDIPVVFANGYGSRYGGRAGRICVDNEAVARAAFRELAAGNPKAFAVVGESSSPEWSVVRVKAFRAEVAKTGLPCRVFRENKWKEEKESAAYFRPILAALPRHTAIYAVNDPIARRIATAASAAGLRIPQDLTLLGTDNNPDWCEAASPTLSSIQLDFERMGYLAASLLAARMTDRAARGMTNRAARGMTDRAARGMTNHAARGMTDRATRGMTTAACAANDDALLANDIIPSLPPKAVRHCASGASSLPPSAASSLADGGDGGTVATIGPLLAVRREATRGHGRREPIILAAVEIIRREACDGLTVAKLAARLPGSRRLLDLRFREAMGHSVHEEILQVRLERVFDLLRRPGTPISAIADLSGFALHQLDKVFRTRFGCSLRDWRKRNA